MKYSFLFPLLVMATLVFGFLTAGSFPLADSEPYVGSATPSFLTELHLHGSLSEGPATMWHHSKVGAAANYDVLWWTDHMERVSSRTFPQEIGFNSNSMVGSYAGGPLGFRAVGDVQKSVLGSGGQFYAHFEHTPTISTSSWSFGGLKYFTNRNFERMSLMAEPVLEMKLRLASIPHPNHASFVIRVTLSSSRGDGLTNIGRPNVLEYIPLGLVAPDLDPADSTNTQQLPTLGLDTSAFTVIRLYPQIDAAMHFPEGDDQSIIKVEILATGRNGQSLAVDFDDFSLRVSTSKVNKALLVAAEQRVKSATFPYDQLTQNVGMEMAGPAEQPISQVGTRDHIIALYPSSIQTAISQIYDYVSPGIPTVDWPQDGIDDVHNDGGIAILAHLFSSISPPEVLDSADLITLATRVVTNEAWGADGIEIGYSLRGAPMEEFLKVWDKLSERGTFITGVGVSDNHDVQDWNLRDNRFGTWIQAPSDSSIDLTDAIRSGHAFFGDPFHFDPAGGLVFREINDAYGMGDVVVVTGQPQTIGISISGAHVADDLVWFVNGAEVLREPFLSSGSISTSATFSPVPGDWVRVQVHGNANQPYLLSNPIYFVANTSEVPLHRAP